MIQACREKESMHPGNCHQRQSVTLCSVFNHWISIGFLRFQHQINAVDLLYMCANRPIHTACRHLEREATLTAVTSPCFVLT